MEKTIRHYRYFKCPNPDCGLATCMSRPGPLEFNREVPCIYCQTPMTDLTGTEEGTRAIIEEVKNSRDDKT
jgi:hypothetical protein